MIAALYWGINFLKGRDLFTSSVHYYAVYDQVNGLQSSAAVLIKGYKVGSISDISFDPERSDKVVVEFSIKSKFKIPDDTKARIFSDGLMGGKAVELELGKSAKYLQQGDTLFSEINKDFLEVAGSEFEFLKQRANDVINQLMITLGHINTLMADNKDNLNATFTNIASISGNLNEVIAGEKNNVREIVQNLNELSKTLNGKSGQIDRIVTNVENFSDSLSKSKIPTMIAQVTTTLESLNTTLEKVNHGDGTVGRFLNDQALYDELVDATANLSALLEDLKAHPSRYINVSVFGRRNRDE
jgi:phospholipid/cholesterol/gamma-HCH transport system substrate-binding protein